MKIKTEIKASTMANEFSIALKKKRKKVQVKNRTGFFFPFDITGLSTTKLNLYNQCKYNLTIKWTKTCFN